MVSRMMIVVLFASFLLTVSSTTWADSTSEAKAAIQAAYNQQNAGYTKLDVQTVLSHTTVDFVGGDGGRVLHKPMLVIGLNQLFANLNKIHGHFERTTTIDKIDVSGSQATVLTKVHIRASAINSNTGEPVVTEGGGATKDVWLKTKGGWLQKSYIKLSGTG